MAERQPYPVGDTEYGQLVQVGKPLPTTESQPIWTDFDPITVSTAVINLGAPRLSNNRAYITVETNPIRYTVDGTAPTATVGHLLSAGDVLELESAHEVREFQTIRQGAADATIMVSYGNI